MPVEGIALIAELGLHLVPERNQKSSPFGTLQRHVDQSNRIIASEREKKQKCQKMCVVRFVFSVNNNLAPEAGNTPPHVAELLSEK